jgi:hypothetical protein
MKKTKNSKSKKNKRKSKGSWKRKEGERVGGQENAVVVDYKKGTDKVL